MIKSENTEKHKELRQRFNKETGIYAIKDNESYMNWLENIVVKNCSIPLVSGSAIADLNHIAINAVMNIQGLTDNEPQVQEECGKIINAVRFFSKHYR